jgi:hypothetical protein
MKNTIKFFGIIALVAVIGFSMAACGGGGGGGGGGGSGGSGALGKSLSLSGQVYTEEMNLDGIISGKGGSLYKYTPFTGSVYALTSTVGGTGSITNGKLSFTVGALPDSELQVIGSGGDALDLGEYFTGDIYKDLKVTPADTKSMGLDFDELSKMKMDLQMKGTSYSMNMEMVIYVYVNQDCVITATGGTATMTGAGSVMGGSMIMKAANMNLSLKEGWNVMNVKATSSTGVGTMSIKTGDLSSCRWVYDDGSDDFEW